MLRRLLSAVLLLLLCLPATSLAVLYTCTMDGLTRMSDCEEHAELMRSHEAGQGERHGCEQAARIPERCCDVRVVTASLEMAPGSEVPSPVGPVVYLARANDVARAPVGFSGSVDAPPWRGPPLYTRFASYLI
ncbi:MAG: hypothetical protein P8R42_20385 [Candidatus Binatia bacterium]|nr:hypothetical protein [Candidatus Binatia bacterium]